MHQTGTPDTPGAQIPPPRPQDVESVSAVVAALYDVISGTQGAQRDWDRLRSLFIPDARLIPQHRFPPRARQMMDIEAYIIRASEFFQTNDFSEKEVAARIETFGNIAHVFSTYEARYAAADAHPFMRGINSIQLLKEDGRWWVVSILWDVEQEDNPIPVQYLPKP